MRIGSLFSGIGGLDKGLEWATGGEISWFCESDPYARSVLAKRWPTVPCYTDVRDLDEETPVVDLLSGGFPCQDISCAGKGAGIKGPRSSLWYEFARVIRLLRPRYVFVENVPALASRGLGDVLGDLAACGYDAEWDCIGACCVGAPHRRLRLFIVATDALRRETRDVPKRSAPGRLEIHAGWKAEPRDHGEKESLAHADSGRRKGVWEPEPFRVESASGSEPDGCSAIREQLDAENGPDSDLKRRHGRTRESECSARLLVSQGNESWSSEPGVGRVAYGVPNRVDRLRCLGNAVVPHQAQKAWELLVARIHRT